MKLTSDQSLKEIAQLRVLDGQCLKCRRNRLKTQMQSRNSRYYENQSNRLLIVMYYISMDQPYFILQQFSLQGYKYIGDPVDVIKYNVTKYKSPGRGSHFCDLDLTRDEVYQYIQYTTIKIQFYYIKRKELQHILNDYLN